MKKLNIIIYIVLLIPLFVLSQESIYFNNTYNNLNGISTGMCIIEDDGEYIGYGVTSNSSTIGQKLFFIKMNSLGEEIFWKQFGVDNQSYFPGLAGGSLLKTIDNQYALTFTYSANGNDFGSLIKLNNEMDTIWQRSYNPVYKTATYQGIQTNDKGYLLTGQVFQSEEDFGDAILLKTDSLGNYLWHQLYGGYWSEHGTNIIQTPDNGYLLGGFYWEPGIDHSQDAMIIKTDSLGNEQWTKYYGNPDVNDAMAHVTMADDGNYLVATVYGDVIFGPSLRTGRIYLAKIDNNGNTIWEKEVGPNRLNRYTKNLRKLSDGFILTGFSKETDTATYQYTSGWMMKLDNNMDSVWYRDYVHNVNDWENFFYDASPTSDNGYIAIGQARPDMGGSTNKMWVVKVDSMGCDTPGCFIVDIDEQVITRISEGLKVWPNPTQNKLQLSGSGLGHTEALEVWSDGNRFIRIYNSQGMKVDEIGVPDNIESLEIDASGYLNGLYYLQYIHSGQILETLKFIKN